MKDWTLPIYVFFEPTPANEYHDKRQCHVFKCVAYGCKHHIQRYLDKKDAKSTGNMRKHMKSCWGEAALQAAMELDGPIKSLLGTRSIKTSFERKGKGKVTYSHRQHTRAETRFTGRPEYYLPSLSTVAHDVKQVFVKTRKRIATMLQNYEGKLNFATDAWTSPNHRAYVALSVHLEHEGQPLAMILDILEVAKVNKTYHQWKSR
ncbi:uncharacterized protein EDB91DRAFT_1236585 [Suillus paluster]|uniref:uncharacterized protein n=1 Tax=Suillus paluster TaxID=48578 RepID=UPI001B87C428|nr:uncharacterized protein EDB91DRAFT_1236585 [Suillus paluster]KAG1744007.1 hypothetical protein EDB91DRAFT_1236585 [Suillus paluster]